MVVKTAQKSSPVKKTPMKGTKKTPAKKTGEVKKLPQLKKSEQLAVKETKKLIVEEAASGSSEGKSKQVKSNFGCYRCHSTKHKIKNCPDMESETTGVKTCFKCGSTEHMSRACHIKSNDKFPYAVCVQCKKTGHLARQCPERKGIYPLGGECYNCGSIDHLKADCPTLAKKPQSAEKVVKGKVAQKIDPIESADAEMESEDDDEDDDEEEEEVPVVKTPKTPGSAKKPVGRGRKAKTVKF